MFVCLVDNGAFTAAAVAYNNTELRAFMNVGDYRPKTWFAVPIAALIDNSGLGPDDLKSFGLIR